MMQGLLSWRHCPSYPKLISPQPFSTARFPKPKLSTIAVTLNSIEEESPLTGREKRRMRNEGRERKSGYSWKEEVEMKFIEKEKKGKKRLTWREELNLNNLAEMGLQWWVVRVPRTAGQETADMMARSLARNFRNMDFKVSVPSVQIKRKLKDGSISVKAKPLYPGCIFLRCVMNKEIHDFIRKRDGVRGFLASTVGNSRRQINKPQPFAERNMESIFKQAKEEQEKANQAFEEEQQKDEDSVSQDLTQTNGTKKPGGRKTGKAKALKPGSSVVIVSGPFAGYSGTLKKLDKKTGLATVGFTVFGKDTLANIAANEILAATK